MGLKFINSCSGGIKNFTQQSFIFGHCYLPKVKRKDKIPAANHNNAKAVTQTMPGSPKTAATEEVKKLIVTGAPVTGDKIQAAANPANPRAAESRPVLTGRFPNEHFRKSG